ncbi:MAG: RluA family pseudouridine synthase [Firmicutes bacterium]|nr:RluA family pseudouridine synthase [Bacillota bacterium]
MDNLSIIHEDNHIIVVIKPMGVPSQEDASGDPDMLTIIKQYRKTNEGKEGSAYVGLVHRLDRVTGGVMVFAKTSKAAARLSAQLQDGGFAKKYLAVLSGVPRERVGTLEHYLLKNERLNKVDVVGAAVSGAKRAELNYRVRTIAADNTLVEIDLITGRSHQARVQMATMGTPIYGDNKYGKNERGGLALWAHELQFTHPTTTDRMRFVVNPPEDGVWAQFDFARKSHKTKDTPPTEEQI